MKKIIPLLLFLSSTSAYKIRKRFINDQNTTNEDSFQVNVSAGYGVHSENITHHSPIYQFQERKSQNETIHQNPPVHEKAEKHFQHPKSPRRRPQPDPKYAGTKIVEVLRVPAMYELHLQADPQRLASINSAWLDKLMSHQMRKPAQPVYQFTASKTVAPIQQNFLQASSNNYHQFQRYQPAKVRYAAAKAPAFYTAQKLAPQASNLQGYKYPKPVYQNALTSYTTNLPVTELKKPVYQNVLQSYTTTVPVTPVLEVTTQRPASNEIPADYYQKPQALHEVPAPVLDKNSQNYGAKPTVPSLVYGKPQEAAPIFNPQDLYQEPQALFFRPNNYVKQEPLPAQYQNPNVFNSESYQGFKNVQNFYNDAIGDHLDQSLVNVNGEVATYFNPDGTMTVSNFHHNPKLYKNPNDYVIPVSESPIMDEALPTYSSEAQTAFSSLNSQLFNSYNAEIPISGNHLDLTKQDSPAASRSDYNERFPRFNQMVTNRMYKKPLRRRYEPMNYVIYIKEKTLI